MAFMLVAVAFAAFVAIAGMQTQEPKALAATTTLATTSTTLVQTTSTSTTSPPQTTTTTLFTPPMQVFPNVTEVDKCRDTELGKMNRVLVELDEEEIDGYWIGNSTDSFSIDCDGRQVPADIVLYRGGRNIQKGDDLPGEYRLMVRCGRNQPVEDLQGCRQMSVSFATRGQNITSYLLTAQTAVNATTTTSPATTFTFPEPETTTTTLYSNPYLEKFMGQGYHKATLKVSWLCPSCVPAVNNLVIREPGVKSRSLMYGQKINYVIYDPTVVDLERVIELTGSGGDVELINDTEI